MRWRQCGHLRRESRRQPEQRVRVWNSYSKRERSYWLLFGFEYGNRWRVMLLDGEGVLMADIRKVSYTDILGAPNAKELFAKYESECANPELSPINP